MPDILTVCVYLVLVAVPVLFFWLAYRNKRKFNKYRSTGRIPDIEAASRNYSTFLTLAIAAIAGLILFFVEFGI